MNTLKANLSKLVRAENRDGRDYLVAPVVLITEGVHNNIFYPAEELKKFPDAWNGRPLPLYHPQKNGTPITANSPDVIEAQAVGQVFNVNFENATDKHPARLKGEVWIDTAKLNALVEGGHHDAKALASMLHNNQPIEVSTGLFTDDELSAGKWNGEDYVAIARNHRPDHLALLPEGVGACSLADGCGTPRVNNEEGAQTVISRISGLVKRLLDKPKTNELTNRDKRAAIDAKLSQMTEIGAYTSIVDFGSDFVVYSQYREGEGEKMLRRDLTISEDDQVTIGSEVTEVTRRTEYIPAAPVPSPPIMATNTKAEETDAMENEKLVDALIANEATEFTADDKPALMKMNESQLEALQPKKEEPAPEAPKTNCGCGGKAPEAAPAAPAPEAPKTLSAEDVAKIVTETVKSVVPEMIKANAGQHERDLVIARLKGNERCKLSEETLAKMSVNELVDLEGSLSPNSFIGRGLIRQNESGEKDVAPVMPNLFDKKN